jgi:hypothetical protein
MARQQAEDHGAYLMRVVRDENKIKIKLNKK